MTRKGKSIIEHVARLNRQWLPMPAGMALPKSSSAVDIFNDALVVTESLNALVLAEPGYTSIDRAEFLRSIRELAETSLPEEVSGPKDLTRQTAWMYANVLLCAARLEVPDQWPQREQGELVQLGRALENSALEAVRKVAAWFLWLPSKQPDDAMLVRVVAEFAQLAQDGMHFDKVSSLLVAEAREYEKRQSAKSRGPRGPSEIVTMRMDEERATILRVIRIRLRRGRRRYKLADLMRWLSDDQAKTVIGKGFTRRTVERRLKVALERGEIEPDELPENMSP